MSLSEIVTPGGFFNLAPLVVLFPAIGMLINILFGGRMGEKAIGLVASLGAGAAFGVAALLGYSLVTDPHGGVIPLAEWIGVGEMQLRWALRVDTLSVTMMLVVAGVGTLIHIYSIGYMHEDVRHNDDPGRYRRFFVFLNLFIAMMMILVSADNYLMLFVGWEGVGLCSYLLIGFWYDKGKNGIGNALAAKKAFITNRVGDFGFLLAAFILFWAFKSFDFAVVAEKAPQIAAQSPELLLAITLFMLLGVAGKSAQLPLHVWLPDAMAGPTPVSALIHAATMVTAGVYLVARSYALYSLVPQAQMTVALVGGTTALFAATLAVVQFDIKKVLAYSTISQLGFMVAAVGMGAFVAGMFHLVMHAFFKALLFLSAGAVIQGMEAGEHASAHAAQAKSKSHRPAHADPQDMRQMGGLRSRMKLTFGVYLIGALALAGIFPLAGFWSKDEILAEAQQLQPAVYWLLTIAAFFTAFYMGRQVLLVFFGEPRSAAAEHAAERPAVMTVPLAILALLSLIGGALNLPYVHTFTGWLEHTIPLAAHGGEAEASYMVGGLNLLVAGFSTLLALAGLFLAWLVYGRGYAQLHRRPPAQRVDDPLRPRLAFFFSLPGRKYYDTRLAEGYRLFSDFLAQRVDLGGIDRLANGLAALFQGMAARLRRIQTGYVRNYALAVMLGVVVILGYLILR